MIRVQDQCNIQRLCHRLVRGSAVQHIREIRRMAQVRARSDRFFSVANAVECRNERGGLRGQPDGLTEIRFGRHVFGIAIEHRKHGRRRAKGFHRKRLVRQRLHVIDYLLWNHAGRRQLFGRVVQFGVFRQAPEPQKMACFLERRVCCQLVDVVSAIREYSLLTIDVTNRGFTRYDVFQSRFHSRPRPCFARP